VTLRLTPAETDGATTRRRRPQGRAEAPVEPQGEPLEATPDEQQQEEQPKRARRPAARKSGAPKAEGTEKRKRTPRRKKEGDES
jgi:hypothetical protein